MIRSAKKKMILLQFLFSFSRFVCSKRIVAMIDHRSISISFRTYETNITVSFLLDIRFISMRPGIPLKPVSCG